MSRSREHLTKFIVSQSLTKPLPIYSHAATYAGSVFSSGIQGFIPGTFNLPPDVADEAEQMMENMNTLLSEAGSSIKNVVKLTFFFTDMKRDFLAVNDVINRYFPEHPPARSSIGVSDLPRGCRVVVECIAAGVQHENL